MYTRQMIHVAAAAFSLVFFMTGGPVAALACSPSDIEIKQADWHRKGSDYVEIVGEIINNCAEPTGVELQIVFRDSSAKVVAVFEPWPASTRNIAAHTNYPFSTMTTVDAAGTTMNISILDTRRW